MRTDFAYENVPYGAEPGMSYTLGMVPVLKQVTAADGAVTKYTYQITKEAGNGPDPTEKWHADLTRIEDPNGHAYQIEYGFDHSKWNFKDSENFTGYYYQTGVPRNVQRVILPDGQVAVFENQSNVALQWVAGAPMPVMKTGTLSAGGSSYALQRQTRVTDAAGKVTTYQWTQPYVRKVNSLLEFLQNPENAPKVVYFTTMKVIYAGVGEESYDFNPDAGMAVCRTTDLSGNNTAFYYRGRVDGAVVSGAVWHGAGGQYGVQRVS